MTTRAAPQNRDDFQVAIVCALSLEAEGVLSVFDTFWEEKEIRYGKAPGDQNAYTTGSIAQHNVVLVHMSSMGNTSAAISAAGLRSSFPGIRLVLVVGVCGVVPFHYKTNDEIILGDVFISTSLVQYDFGRQYPGGFRRKQEINDSLGRASPEVRSLLNKLQTRQNHRRLNENLKQVVLSEKFKKQNPAAIYPGVAQDRLFEATYLHQHRPEPQFRCDKCHDGLDVCSLSCDELGCEEVEQIRRIRHVDALSNCVPLIHFGRFGSANSVMRSGMDRDRVAMADEVIAFEMEGAGIWDQYPTIIVKAACDYADSHKNKRFQTYAAATAAACLKVFLNEWAMANQVSNEGLSHKPVWHVPFDRTSQIVGRLQEMKRIEQTVSEGNGRRLSILGLGGVGKSRLALEAAYQTRAKHPECSIFWVHAAEQVTFEKDIVDIGRKLGITGMDKEGAEVKNLVKQYLSHTSNKWVLILDNADDESLWSKQTIHGKSTTPLEVHLPRSPNGSIIVTTRTRNIATFMAGKEVIELTGMPPEQAVEMFTDALEKPELAVDDATAYTLVRKVAYLPLAIVQASSFINRTQESASTYVRLLDQAEENVIELLSRDFEEPSGYQQPLHCVASTWLISFRQIRDRHPLAATYLTWMACLHEKSIPLSLLPQESPNKVVDAIAVLLGYSFISKHNTQSTTVFHERLYDMHRLVRLSTRNWLREEGQLATRMAECVKILAKLFPVKDYHNKDRWTVYLPHAQSIHSDSLLENVPERYELIERIGGCLLADGRFKQAAKMYETTLQWRKAQSGGSHPTTLATLANLANALRDLGDWSRASICMQEAIDGNIAIFGREHPDVLGNMSDMGRIYVAQGKLAQAETLMLEVVDAYRRVLGEEHLSTINAMLILSTVHSSLGRYKDAESMALQVLVIREKLLSIEHPLYLDSMATLAAIYMEQQKWGTALELQLQMVELAKKVYGDEHPGTLEGLNNLGVAYLGLGRWQEGTELLENLKQINERVYGADHAESLATTSNLAECYYHLNENGRAAEMQETVVRRAKEVFGIEHPKTLTAMNNLAVFYLDGDRSQQAERLLKEILELTRQLLGPEHPDVFRCMANLASAYYGQKRWKAAEELQVPLLNKSEQLFGPNHESTVLRMWNLARTLEHQDRNDEANALLTSCVERAIRGLGPDHYLTKRASDTLEEWNHVKTNQYDVHIPGAWVD